MGVKNVYRVTSSKKEQITILACEFATGSFEKPHVIFPGKFHFGNVDCTKYSLGHSPNGWMTNRGKHANLILGSEYEPESWLLLGSEPSNSEPNFRIFDSNICSEHYSCVYGQLPYGQLAYTQKNEIIFQPFCVRLN